MFQSQTQPASDLGVYFDGDLVDVQLTATDPDPNDNLTWSLQSGNIPQWCNCKFHRKHLWLHRSFCNC